MCKIKCENCFHNCKLNSGQTGICRVWKNIDNELVCTNYGKLTSLAIDPIEKKPLKEFYPGSMILSIGSFGCNLRCKFCQNHSISQHADIPYKIVLPEELRNIAIELRESRNNIGVAYTYNEPLISYPYLYDCMELIHKAGMKNVVVTNGCISATVLKSLLPYIDAMNIDLKGFSDDIYNELQGSLDNVLENIKLAAKCCHLELTSLIVPGMNDDIEMMESQAKWIASIDDNIPLHITRYFPQYRMDVPPTPIEVLYKLSETAKTYLNKVYLGNV